MCGIVGYIGERDAKKVLLDGLLRLEYRGYDSAGIALRTENGIEIKKTKGRISDLERIVGDCCTNSMCGIGHTRWATHGEPSQRNSHPHMSADGRVTLVHNGIIENYIQLKLMLESEGVVFKSETDTEVAVNLIAKYYKSDPLEAIYKAMNDIRGSFALAIMFDGSPDELYAVKKDNPLIIGIGNGNHENFIASDIPAILKWTRDYIVLGELEVAKVTRDGVYITDKHGAPVEPRREHVMWNYDAAEKGGYPHFMLKEIFEQPTVLRDTIGPRIKDDGIATFEDEGLTDEILRNTKRIYIAACGSALHSGIIGRTFIERLAGIPAEYEVASEFRYRDPILYPDDLVVIISQSGETADSLAALRLAKAKGLRTVAIVNVVGSSIARAADVALYMNVGPEIAVATTKAFSAQVAMLLILAIQTAKAKGKLTNEKLQELSRELSHLPQLIGELMPLYESTKQLAGHLAQRDHIFFIGRGLDYAACYEGSLKLKEISYIHSEAYAAGELKHGTISLIEPDTPVIAIATQKEIFEKTVSNIKEVKARGAFVVLITGKGMYDANGDSYADYVIEVPECNELLLPSLVVVACQIISYNVAAVMGCDIDKPRNLAKSVTVE